MNKRWFTAKRLRSFLCSPGPVPCPNYQPRLANCLDELLPEHLEMLFYRSRRRFEDSLDQHSKRKVFPEKFPHRESIWYIMI